MKKNLLVVLFCIVGLAANAQAPSIQWQKCYGGTGADNGMSVKQTLDGGFIAVGTTASTTGDVSGNQGGTDIWVVKLNATGTIEWSKAIGTTGADNGEDVSQSSDGSYYVTGYTSANAASGNVTGTAHGGGDAIIARLSATGTLKWAYMYGGSAREQGMAVVATTDGGCAISGGSASASGGQVTGHHGSGNDDVWICRVDSMGTFLWSNCAGGTQDDGGDGPTSIIQTSDNGFVILGNTGSTDGDLAGATPVGGVDYLVCRLSSAGAKTWTKRYGGPATEDPAASVCQAADGTFAVVGQSDGNGGQVTGNHGGIDMWLIKIDATGALTWQLSLGGPSDDIVASVSATSDGGFLVSGATSSTTGDITGNHGGSDYWLAKVSGAGALVWQKCLGGTGADVGMTAMQTADGGYVVTGSGVGATGDLAGGGNHGAADFWIVKLGAATGIENMETINNEVLAYPNPSHGQFILSSALKISGIEVINAIGEKIYSAKINTENVQLNLSHETKGIYFYTLRSNDAIIGRGKLIVQ